MVRTSSIISVVINTCVNSVQSELVQQDDRIIIVISVVMLVSA